MADTESLSSEVPKRLLQKEAKTNTTNTTSAIGVKLKSAKTRRAIPDDDANLCIFILSKLFQKPIQPFSLQNDPNFLALPHQAIFIIDCVSPQSPCKQNSWHMLLKILPCPKLRLRAVTTSNFLKELLCHNKKHNSDSNDEETENSAMWVVHLWWELKKPEFFFNLQEIFSANYSSGSKSKSNPPK